MRIALPMMMLCLAPGLLTAQKLVVGPRLGLNIAQFTGDGVGTEARGRAGYYMGFYGAYPVRKKLSLSMAMLYASEGLTYEGTMPNGNRYQAKRKLAYLNFPVVAHYHVTERIAVATGPQLGVLLSAKNRLDIGGNQTAVDIRDEHKGYALGWVAGAQYQLHAHLALDVRYHWGISDIMAGQLSRRSRMWQMGLMMRF